MLYVSDAEVEVLKALEDGNWRVAVEVADHAGLHVQKARGMLKVLTGGGLVERAGWGEGRWGQFRITDRGRDELAERRQLKLAI